jgi:hypothetical protein
MPGVPTLVNLTRKPKFVVVDGVLFRLPEAARPRVIELQSAATRRTLVTQVGDVELHLDEIDMVGNLVSEPPRVDSTLWLVDTDVFSQFPGRVDFVRPAAYKLVNVGDIDCSLVDAAVLKEAELHPGSIMVLAVVSRSRLVASATAQRLDEIEICDADEPAHADGSAD